MTKQLKKSVLNGLDLMTLARLLLVYELVTNKHALTALQGVRPESFTAEGPHLVVKSDGTHATIRARLVTPEGVLECDFTFIIEEVRVIPISKMFEIMVFGEKWLCAFVYDYGIKKAAIRNTETNQAWFGSGHADREELISAYDKNIALLPNW